MKNDVFWNVTPCGSCKNQRLGGIYSQRTSGASSACVVPSSPIFVTPMKEESGSSETRFLQEPHGVISQKTPFLCVYIPEDGILHSHTRENLKSFIALTGCDL
jgi:hypothetical protein